MLDIDAIYEDKHLIEKSDGTFACPVCHKVYKRKTIAEKHLTKQDCHSALDVFKDTAYEKMAYDFYVNLLNENGHKWSRPTMSSFRKSKMYKQVNRFVLASIVYEADTGTLYSFLNEIVGFKHTSAILSKGQDEKWIEEYRLFLHCHPEVGDSSNYYGKYEDELLSDEDFLIKSIQKAHISVGYITKRPKLSQAVEDLPVGYKMQVIDIMDKMEECKWQ